MPASSPAWLPGRDSERQTLCHRDASLWNLQGKPYIPEIMWKVELYQRGKVSPRQKSRLEGHWQGAHQELTEVATYLAEANTNPAVNPKQPSMTT